MSGLKGVGGLTGDASHAFFLSGAAVSKVEGRGRMNSDPINGRRRRWTRHPSSLATQLSNLPPSRRQKSIRGEPPSLRHRSEEKEEDLSSLSRSDSREGLSR